MPLCLIAVSTAVYQRHNYEALKCLVQYAVEDCVSRGTVELRFTNIIIERIRFAGMNAFWPVVICCLLQFENDETFS